MDLAQKIKEFKELGGIDSNLIEKQMDEFKTKDNANEVMHTGNTGYGEELVPTDELTQDVLNMIPEYGSFLGQLRGFHGNNMGKSVSMPIIGDVGFARGIDERTSSALSHNQATRKMSTDKVTITQQTLYMNIDISRQELLYSVDDLSQTVKTKMAKAFSRTLESAMINGDTSDTATGNINCADATPSSTFADGAQDHRLLFDGLRKTFLSGSVNVDYKDVGSPSWANLIQTRGLLGDYSFDLDNMLLLMNGKTYNKYLTITEFADASKNGQFSTIQTGKVDGPVSGVQMAVPRDYPLTYTDGLAYNDTTTYPSDKGGFMFLRKDAIQYGYGDPIDMENYKVVGQGVTIVAAMDAGFTVVNKKAGVQDPRVVGGINVTV